MASHLKIWNTFGKFCDRTGEVVGLHAHAGSGIRDGWNWREKAELLSQIAEQRDSVRILNLGGGFGIPSKQGESRLDIQVVSESLAEFTTNHPKFEIWIEPGRYLVAEGGIFAWSCNADQKQGAENVCRL